MLHLRYDFQVVIAGSNGYVNNSIATPTGYQGPVSLGNAAINAPKDCNKADTCKSIQHMSQHRETDSLLQTWVSRSLPAARSMLAFALLPAQLSLTTTVSTLRRTAWPRLASFSTRTCCTTALSPLASTARSTTKLGRRAMRPTLVSGGAATTTLSVTLTPFPTRLVARTPRLAAPTQPAQSRGRCRIALPGLVIGHMSRRLRGIGWVWDDLAWRWE
jgi:hypothetical protein